MYPKRVLLADVGSPRTADTLTTCARPISLEYGDRMRIASTRLGEVNADNVIEYSSASK